MINKRTYKINSDKKVLHKIGKRWMTVSTLLLGLAGGTTMLTHSASAQTKPMIHPNTDGIKHLATQGRTTPASQNNTSVYVGVKQSATPSATSTSAPSIMNQASTVHLNLMLNVAHRDAQSNNNATANNVQSVNSNSAQPVSASASVVSSKASNGMTTFHLGDSAQQSKAFSFVEAGVKPTRFSRPNTANPSVNNTNSNIVNNKASNSQSANVAMPQVKSSINVAPQVSVNNRSASTENGDNFASNVGQVDANSNSSSNSAVHFDGLGMVKELGDPAPTASNVTEDFMFMNSDYEEGSPFKVTAPSGANISLSASNSNVIAYTNGQNPSAVGKVPTTYTLVSNQSFIIKNDPSDNNIPEVQVATASKSTNNSDAIIMNSDIPVVGDMVTFKGNIVLHFPTTKQANGTQDYRNITIPYSIATEVNHNISDILHDGIQNGNLSVMVPSDYINQTIQEFSTKNYTFNSHESSSLSDYKPVYVGSPSYESKNGVLTTKNKDNSYIYQNKDLNFWFTASNVKETIDYRYNNSTVASSVVSGANNTQGSLASNDVPSGWSMASSANGNSWIYSSGSIHNINVVPAINSATIDYKFIQGSKTVDLSNLGYNNDIVGSYTAKGPDARTIASGTSFSINASSAINTGLSGVNSIGLPAGYQIVMSNGNNGYEPLRPGQDINIAYNGQTQIEYVQGTMHNPNNYYGIFTNNGNPITSKPQDNNSKQSDYVPASDVNYIIPIKLRKIDNGHIIDSETIYEGVTGRTNDTGVFLRASDWSKTFYQPGILYLQGYTTGTDTNLKENPSDSPAQTYLTANGVSNAMTGTPITNNNPIVFNYYSEEGQTITVHYYSQSGMSLGNPITIKGHVDDTGTINPSASLPSEYNKIIRASDNGKQISNATISKIPYKISTNAQDINVYVQGTSIHPKHIIQPSHPNLPSDMPNNPQNPSDVPSSSINTPNGSVEVPSNNGKPNPTSTIPNSTNTQQNKPYSNPSDLTPASSDTNNQTFYIIINDFGYDRKNGKYDKLERQYAKRFTPTGNAGDPFTINSNAYKTDGYSPMSNNNYTYKGYISLDNNKNEQLVASDGKTPQNSIVWNYIANPQTATINFENQNSDYLKPSGISSQSSNDEITIHGHTDSDINVIDPNDGGVSLPKNYPGYHALSTDYAYHFSSPNTSTATSKQYQSQLANPNATYRLQGDKVSGTAIVNALYTYADGIHVALDKTGDNAYQNKFSARIGDTIRISPKSPEFMKDNFKVNNSSEWNTLLTPSDDKQGLVLNNKQNPFRYKSRDATITVSYIDISKGASNSGDTTIHFGKNTYPIIGTQHINYTGILGRIVNLLPYRSNGKNSDGYINNSDWNVLKLPDGYHLWSASNSRELMPEDKSNGLGVVHVGKNFGVSFRPVSLSTPIYFMLSKTANTKPKAPTKKPNNNNNKPVVKNGSIEVQYMYNGNEVGHTISTQKVGTPFDATYYVNNDVPDGYTVDYIGNPASVYTTTPQVVKYDVTKTTSIIPSDDSKHNTSSASASPIAPANTTASSKAIVPSDNGIASKASSIARSASANSALIQSASVTSSSSAKQSSASTTKNTSVSHSTKGNAKASVSSSSQNTPKSASSAMIYHTFANSKSSHAGMAIEHQLNKEANSNIIINKVPAKSLINVPNVKSSQRTLGKLPQTGESTDAITVSTVLMLLASITLAGVDALRKHDPN